MKIYKNEEIRIKMIPVDKFEESIYEIIIEFRSSGL